jgi:cytochrome P450
MARLMDRLATRELDRGTDHFDPSTLQVVTIDVGNEATNVIPAEARATVNIRFNDAHSGASLTEWLRAEVDAVVGDAALQFEHTRQLPLIRAFFKETLRLYPPITFIPRVALEATQVGRRRLRRGALVMISPWTLHRHQAFWEAPNSFRPERFLPENEAALNSDAYIPFGQGPHLCVGAGFAQAEAILIIASLIRRFDFTRADTAAVRPAARLTTRPTAQIWLHATSRDGVG